MKVIGLHHVRFAVTDLEKAEAFGLDFGLKTVSQGGTQLIMRTSGGGRFCYIAELGATRGFQGMAFTVADRLDLEEAVARHGATAVRSLDTPGGGWGLALTDTEGLRINLVTGIADGPRDALSSPVSLNLSRISGWKSRDGRQIGALAASRSVAMSSMSGLTRTNNVGSYFLTPT
jgi:catechol 2,3-dioxygenase-like lactoylglutathione lyase family enzyme